MLKIDHLNRFVSDVDAFVAFYREALDYVLLERGMKKNGRKYAILQGQGHEIDLIQWTEKEKFYASLDPAK